MPVICALFNILASVIFLLSFPIEARCALAVLAPSQPTIERQPEKAARNPAAQPGNTAGGGAQKGAVPEVDILYALMDVFAYAGRPVDRPQQFAALRFDEESPQKDGELLPERSDLLGDMEEISYLGQKAWGINMALEKAGLYQFIAEGRPRWDEAGRRFVQQTAKSMLPVFGVDAGWSQPAGFNFEIVPLTRPFGLIAPALFSGRVLLGGRPLAGAPVSMRRINADRKSAGGVWQREMRAITDADGQFVFLLDRGGWWGCLASASGDPIKGPDGSSNPLELGSLIWLYVDDAPQAAGRKQQ